MDKLDERLSRFLAPAATARCIPEAVKRFTTWAPLLIPFYIPRGKDWDDAWSQSQAIQQANTGGFLSAFVALPVAEQAAHPGGGRRGEHGRFLGDPAVEGRGGSMVPMTWSLSNPEYEVALRDDGALIEPSPRTAIMT